MSQQNNTSLILGLLGVAFIVLKLTGHIDWSWWWVTAPFWSGFALMGILAVVALVHGWFIYKRSLRKQKETFDTLNSLLKKE